MRSLLDEKESRTPAQRKIASQILHGARMAAGQRITEEVATLQVDLPVDDVDRIRVEIFADVDKGLKIRLAQLGGEVLYASESAGRVNATLPLAQVERIAELDAVRHIRPWYKPLLNVGTVTAESDATHLVEELRESFGLTGAGVKVGVLSDSYDTDPGKPRASVNIASGDLPGPGNPFGRTTLVTVLSDLPVLHFNAYRRFCEYTDGNSRLRHPCLQP